MGWLFVSTICVTLRLASQEPAKASFRYCTPEGDAEARAREAPFQKEASVYAERQCQEAP
jgi:hypothetical protein